EDLLVASVATCFAVTLVAVLERRDLALRDLDVTGTGHVTKRDDGRFGFVAIELTARVETDAAAVDAVRHAGSYAERACLVSMAPDVRVPVDLVVQPAPRRLEVVDRSTAPDRGRNAGGARAGACRRAGLRARPADRGRGRCGPRVPTRVRDRVPREPAR